MSYVNFPVGDDLHPPPVLTNAPSYNESHPQTKLLTTRGIIGIGLLAAAGILWLARKK
jgi:hypothetical protein